jgi:5-methylcytosine-specific restriction endonuclease McrA
MIKRLLGESPYLPSEEEEDEYIDRTSAEQEQRQQDYEEYLLSAEWELTRTRVLGRDSHRCSHCSNVSSLQIHHMRYIPRWRELNGEISHLITLCSGCHEKTHQS